MGRCEPFVIPSEGRFSPVYRRVYDTSLEDEKLLQVIKIVLTLLHRIYGEKLDPLGNTVFLEEFPDILFMLHGVT